MGFCFQMGSRNNWGGVLGRGKFSGSVFGDGGGGFCRVEGFSFWLEVFKTAARGEKTKPGSFFGGLFCFIFKTIFLLFSPRLCKTEVSLRYFFPPPCFFFFKRGVGCSGNIYIPANTGFNFISLFRDFRRGKEPGFSG